MSLIVYNQTLDASIQALKDAVYVVADSQYWAQVYLEEAAEEHDHNAMLEATYGEDAMYKHGLFYCV